MNNITLGGQLYEGFSGQKTIGGTVCFFQNGLFVG